MISFRLFLSLLLSLSPPVQAQSGFPLYAADASFFPGASKECLDAYNANVTCSGLINGLFYHLFQKLPDADLTALCTAKCYSSLQAHRAKIVSSCKGTTIHDDYVGNDYAPTAWDDEAIYAYNVTCLAGSDGRFCNRQNATDDSACDGCYLRTLQMQLNSPFEGQEPALASLFSSLTSSCRSTGFSTSTPSATIIVNSTRPTSDRTCSSTYKVRKGDTIFSVSASENVSTDALRSVNGLTRSKIDFPSAGSLCIPFRCRTHVVTPKDTCATIASQAGISSTQLMSWNPLIGLCISLAGFINETLCVSNPAGNFAVPAATTSFSAAYTTPAPVPKNAVQGTNAHCGLFYETLAGDSCEAVAIKFNIALRDFRFLNPMLDTDCTNLWRGNSYCVAPVGAITTYSKYPGGAPALSPKAWITHSGTKLNWTAAFDFDDDEGGGDSGNPVKRAAVIPIADGTRVDCWSYLALNDSRMDIADCGRLASALDLPLEDFLAWNAGLASPVGDTSDSNTNSASAPPSSSSPCALAPSRSYCIALNSPTPSAPSAAPNPTPPTPRGADEAKDCITWARMPADWNCFDFYDTRGLTLAAFAGMNPSVGDDCRGLVPGTWYCVAVGKGGGGAMKSTSATATAVVSTASKSTTTATAAAAATATTTPDPVREGTVKGCAKFYKGIADEFCADVAKRNGVSVEDFLRWNPAVGKECGNFWVGYWYCVGGPKM